MVMSSNYSSADLVRDLANGKKLITEKVAENATKLGTKSKSALLEALDGSGVEKAFPDATAGQKKVLKVGTKTVAGATMFIAGTTILDATIKSAKRKDAERRLKDQLKEQEKEQEEKKRSASKSGRGQSFGQSPDMGKVVFDMFEQRTGHHRMGNSHFYK